MTESGKQELSEKWEKAYTDGFVESTSNDSHRQGLLAVIAAYREEHEAEVEGLRDELATWKNANLIGRNVALTAENTALQLRVKELERQVEHAKTFYGGRMNELQKYQVGMPEPHRTAICDILANGKLDPLIPITRNMKS